MLGDLRGDLRGQTFLAGMHRTNGLDQFLAQQPF